jgi:hypothetical protein
MAPNFLRITWHREAFPGLKVQGVEGLILVVLYFYLMEAGEEKERKKKRGKKKVTKSTVSYSINFISPLTILAFRL